MNSKSLGPLLFLQAVLTLAGVILAIYNCATTFSGSPVALGALFALAYFLAYCMLIAYAISLFQREDNFPLQLTAYAYLAVLGIQILQNGQFMPEMGLSEGLVLFVNIANLVAFANIIKFTDKLAEKRMATGYLLVAVLLKLAAELTLIVVLINYVTPIQVLMALSVPILGGTILVAYLNRYNRLTANA